MTGPQARDLIRALPQPALLINADQRIIAANDTAIALMGRDLSGRHMVLGLRQPDLVEAVENCLADAKPRTARYLGHAQGRNATWRAHVRSVDLWVLVTMEDRTAMTDAGEMRRDFVANVSHELQTPLTAIIGYIETLQGPARDDATARTRFLERMGVEARRMSRLVSDLLALSRVEAQERRVPTGEVDLVAVIAAASETLSSMIELFGADMNIRGAERPVMLAGDAAELQQVFTNLIENALKYGGDRVEVTVAPADPVPELRRAGVVVEIRDNGPGIDPLHLPRLTERFYRADSHRARDVGGTGLGLAIVKHVVSRHRGRLKITSTRGEGSTFSVILPCGH
ncbi:sensor histidine kinase [Palleronia caenipelagi]|uniref:histidine kinase n=1 Tax=Palleronia caenipelagi TaxID=2489174 RepID=A0A547Q611_9RHOB|nr:ATP-binding protein [Palleronia caenipelagi]TRD21817.1 two-component sensor histidine kinase [Palleronia caenipelagi]